MTFYKPNYQTQESALPLTYYQEKKGRNYVHVVYLDENKNPRRYDEKRLSGATFIESFDENGKLHGTQTSRPINGTAFRETYWIHGIKNGIGIYVDDGTGLVKKYYDNGKEISQPVWWIKNRGGDFLKALSRFQFGKALHTLFGENANPEPAVYDRSKMILLDN